MNQNKENFERFFEAQPFHQTLRFTEGNRLFICDVIDGVTTYRNLTVQACWATWQHLSKTNISLEAGLRKSSKNKQKLLGKNIELQQQIDEALTWLTRTDIRAINMAREILQGGDLKDLRGSP